ncbi:MAG: hypothetical protein Q4F88_05545 [Eubacteriales bacterium]|nr:hypothetical protein [Eubacteriales bacterium]
MGKKKVVIISTSLRKNSNSEKLAKQFELGALNAGNDADFVPKRAIDGLGGWIDCYEKAKLKGYVFCGGVNEPGDIEQNDKLKEAYKMGESI